MKILLYYLTLLCTMTVSAQINFSKAEIVKTNGEKLKCFVAHISKTKEVTQVFYKKDRKAEILSLNASEVIEIVVRNKKRIRIAKVEIDNRSNEMSKLLFLDRDGSFDLKTRVLPLELLVDGAVPLYKSSFDGIEKFFIKDHNNDIVQLLYKRYFIMREPTQIGNEFLKENNHYFGQLLNEAPCLTNKSKFKPPAFDELKLIGYFERFNSGQCGDWRSK
ncbi:hypothetical protein M3P19_06400 [Muricauda sp. 2012CJ35-5]|uniref:DUF4968 domain-containing protein n=1 Tax=Flagellimonas spongiicola TaxID=2942208 RepID=A0ABT0PQG4_9FLAO|nr:hypothetical protein [Allomuricauda spongiicola]MCL6273632.1 hypothetical protein [Allomuricauda spongiicola]